MNVTLTLPPVLGTVRLTVPDGTPVPLSSPPARRTVTLLPPGREGPPASQEALPARGSYPASTVVNRIHALQDRKAELTDLELTDLVLWFENQIL
ncbi:hypothetical protein [Deinococcus sp. QL22]|uniref:hypothetical protein n=1 Tax=Deinococcus sp. QL22 TaxID=2939437 RepID=UPI002016BADD|nr:hypothetical protein [Deinococcus sp. QL22]UQN05441.1 hypothetical protein M1R55_11205 [Deinococcus sp. QL22]